MILCDVLHSTKLHQASFQFSRTHARPQAHHLLPTKQTHLLVCLDFSCRFCRCLCCCRLLRCCIRAALGWHKHERIDTICIRLDVAMLQLGGGVNFSMSIHARTTVRGY